MIEFADLSATFEQFELTEVMRRVAGMQMFTVGDVCHYGKWRQYQRMPYQEAAGFLKAFRAEHGLDPLEVEA